MKEFLGNQDDVQYRTLLPQDPSMAFVLIQGHWIFHLAFSVVSLFVHFETLRVHDKFINDPTRQSTIAKYKTEYDYAVDELGCIKWDSWANITN